jgi:hypothetical protein
LHFTPADLTQFTRVGRFTLIAMAFVLIAAIVAGVYPQ